MSDLKLAGLFSDHMVLQRDRENAIWGRDLPGQRVSVALEGADDHSREHSAVASSEGRWSLRLPRMAAGGPYRMRVQGSGEIALSDVMVGEVWLASGQSNMEWKLAQADGAEEAIRSAAYDGIRAIKVPNVAASSPVEEINAAWTVCGPGSAGDFSAIGFFFAREIHRSLGVPVGIIDASWGGTYIEAWTSLDALRSVMPELGEELALREGDPARLERIREEYAQKLTRWEADSLPRDPGNAGLREGWASGGFDDGGWKEMDLPRLWQSQGMKFNGVVWFRKTVELPPGWAGRELSLELGAIDDFDQTYFNGELVGEHPDGTPGAYIARREYRVPAGLARPGSNTIAVRVFDHCGEGGFAGPKAAMSLGPAEGGGESIPLSGQWKYAVEREIPLVPMSVFNTFPPSPREITPQHGPAALYHGMIAPLVPYGLRGFLWYQGENNIERHDLYRERQIALIRDWRERFGQGALPFLLVQLAGFRASDDWALLREAQAQATKEPGVAMATAIDIGDPDDIHPRDKLAVGRRLSRIALAEVYGQAGIPCRGPEFERASFEGKLIRASFRHAGGLRTVDGATRVKGFEVAGSDSAFMPATARIEGETVAVESDGVDRPTALRYAWHDYQELNLVNEAGLPALPFRAAAQSAER